VIAIAALVAGIIWAYAHVGWFRDGVQATFKFLGDAAVWLGGVFAAVWDGIVAGFRGFATRSSRSRIGSVRTSSTR
jgi:hypothetical protein